MMRSQLLHQIVKEHPRERIEGYEYLHFLTLALYIKGQNKVGKVTSSRNNDVTMVTTDSERGPRLPIEGC